MRVSTSTSSWWSKFFITIHVILVKVFVSSLIEMFAIDLCDVLIVLGNVLNLIGENE